MNQGHTQLTVSTRAHTEMVDITGQVQAAVAQSGVPQGLCVIFVPHTTAGITINENADPDVPADILMELDRRIPLSDGYRHNEGNSAAHIKAALVGFSQTVFIKDGRLALGTWQGLFFCEFDGPRRRSVWIRIIDA
jgi:secondary thiamine-phosphate synthase enzyme